jgi:hypothetical protein
MADFIDRVEILIGTAQMSGGRIGGDGLLANMKDDLEKLGIDIKVKQPKILFDGFRVTFKNQEDLNMAILAGIIKANKYIYAGRKSYSYIKE